MNDDPLKTAALKEASLWFVMLTSGDATDEDRAGWLAWREQDPAHEYAWEQVEKVTRKFSAPGISAEIGLATLERPASPGRRKILQHMTMVFALGGLSWAGYRKTPWQVWSADYTTAVGEQRHVMLQDGTQLTLNTDSAIDVQFSSIERRVILHRGEIFINTAPDTHQRAFVASTEHGEVTAKGTQFSLRRNENFTLVDLFDGTLEIRASVSQRLQRLESGDTTRFNKELIETPATLSQAQPRWLNGMLVVNDMPLLDFIADLARYRRGYLTGDENLNGLRISGAFPINDTDRILNSLVATLPIEVHRLTEYWLTVKRRA